MILRNLFFCLLQFLFEVNLLREQGYERRDQGTKGTCGLRSEVREEGREAKATGTAGGGRAMNAEQTRDIFKRTAGLPTS